MCVWGLVNRCFHATMKVFTDLYKLKPICSVSTRGFSKGYDYDLIVIGGGSGGLACAKEASSLGKKVAVLDYVDPSPKGNKWGLGGTCVNVGCIPKKLFHQGSLLGESIIDAKSYGWKVPDTVEHDWNILRTHTIQHIKSLNFGHRVQLSKKNVDYLNAKCSFLDSHTVIAVGKTEEKRLTASNFVIAVGGRPRYPNIPGAIEHGITSDDIFFLENPPGKTLIVGGSYIALECAGFISSLGYPSTMLTRSIFLRGFDQEVANLIAENLGRKVQIHQYCIPTKIGLSNSKLVVTWKDKKREKKEDSFDTVLFAIGRKAQTDHLNLEKIGVEVDAESRKIIGINEQSSVPHIYAIGDCLQGKPELTPVATKAGKLLANRLFGNSRLQMDYVNVPTTIFTPLEYGCVGMSEEKAIETYGENDIEVYHAFFKPLEYTILERTASQCYIKVICIKNKHEKVVGIHIFGPHAGEITQGFAVAMKYGLTKEVLDQTVGIHPTCAEEVVKLNITKRSGKTANVTEC